MDKAHIDFETLSGCDIKRGGASKYGRHPSTDIMCLSIGFNDEPIVVVGFCYTAVTPLDSPFKFTAWPECDTLQRLCDHIKRGGICAAHNAPFELEIWNNVGQRKYDLPPLRPEQMDCTMARAYAMALPGSLDGARAAVGLSQEKDAKGHRLMLKLSQPKSRLQCLDCAAGTYLYEGYDCPRCGGSLEVYEWWNDPLDIQKLFSYCGQDNVVEQALDKRLAPLSQREKLVWQLDYRINQRGVKIDWEAAKTARQIVDLEEDRLDEEMRRVTNQQVATCKAHVQLRNWIGDFGIETPGVAKNDVTKLLAQPSLPSAVRNALGIRQEAAKTSTAKLAAMLDRACADHRVRGGHQYWGSNTGRWAARGLQTQNFPRPTRSKEDIARAFDLINCQKPVVDIRDMMEIFIGPPMSVISDCLRGFIIPAINTDFIAIDYSAIEARIVAWIAGELATLNVFRGDGKIYEYQAGLIYRVLASEILKGDIRRDVGKASTLGFGFQGGVGAIQKICKSVGITMEPAFDGLWEIADSRTRDNALSRYKAEVTKALKAHAKECKKAEEAGEKPPRPLVPGLETGINQREWLASELTKVAWRAANPNIVKFWALIEEAAIQAVQHPGVVYDVHPPMMDLPKISYCMRGSFLQCTLPSGRKLTYPYPKISEEETPWGAKKFTLTYMSEDPESKRWMRFPTYGGSLTENVVQAIARDLLAGAMLRCEERVPQYPIVMHVHDEGVHEVPKRQMRGVDFLVKTLEHIYAELPAWASGLPLSAEGWRGARYRK